MNTSGDAAEQVVRFSFEGVEMAVKLIGSGAKELATFLFAALHSEGQAKGAKPKSVKGRERLAAMLKSGKELKVFALKETDLKDFCAQAKRYGVGYTVIRGKRKQLDGLCDVMVPAEQASLVARILERFSYAPTDRATLLHETEVERERGVQTKDAAELLLDEALGAPQQKENPTPTPAAQPQPAGGPPARGSDRSSPSSAKSNSGTTEKRSVKERIGGITAGLRQRREEPSPEKPKAQTQARHKNPARGKKKPKSKGAKSHEL
ncbi:MAG: PcfB family protein [Oscillospiraceae bacterium]|nr:PcfB family protein [Oscillospiraceae bacterium]